MSGGILAAPGWCGLYKEIWKERRLGFGQAIARRVKGVGNSFVRWESMVLDRIRSLRCLFLIWSFFALIFLFGFVLASPFFSWGQRERKYSMRIHISLQKEIEEKNMDMVYKKVEVQELTQRAFIFERQY